MTKSIDTMPEPFKEQALLDIKEHDKAVYFQPPLMFQKVYETFWKLRNGISNDTCISFSEIKAYCDLMHCKLEPYEIELMREMDISFLNKYNEERK